MFTKINYTHKRPYKKLSDSELHQLKNDVDIRLEHRSLAEAEISRRARFSWPVIIMAIAAAITAIFATVMLFKMFMPKDVIVPPPSQVNTVLPPNGKKSDKDRNPRKLIDPKEKIIHNLPQNGKNNE